MYPKHVGRWPAGTAALAALLLMLHPACGGGGGGPSAPACVDQGVAVTARIEPPGASNCSVGNTPFVRVTNNTCASLQVLTIEETLVGLTGLCAGGTAEFTNTIDDTLVPGASTEYELPPWEWCFPGPPPFNCELREDVVVKTDAGDFTASSARFKVFFNAQCVDCSALFGAQGSTAPTTPAIKDDSSRWMP